MAKLHINQDAITPEAARQLTELCPFGAIEYEGGVLSISAGCKMCRICVKQGPQGAVTEVTDAPAPSVNKADWRGVAVFVEHHNGVVHGVTRELLGKARQLAAVTGHPVYAVMMGSGIAGAAQGLLACGADVVYTYDYPELANFLLQPYANAFTHFIQGVKPSSVLVGATNLGRALAPRVAARFRTGLTADCTVLEMKENTDLVQIRPAFGGNIMAQIICPNHRPQFCTVRYKVFSEPVPIANPTGRVQPMHLPPEALQSTVELLAQQPKPQDVDISEAERIVAVGRGVRDMALAQRLAAALGAQLACTRPLVEGGAMDVKRQIGLSGRTVGAKLMVALGVSGAVQFAAGMRGCETIVAINSDENAPIFDIAHYGLVGDVDEILPGLLAQLEGGTPC